MTILLTPSTKHFFSPLEHSHLIEKGYYPDGELYLTFPEFSAPSQGPIKLIHSLCPPIHDNLIFLKLALDHLSLANHKIHLYITYLAYARQPLSIVQSIANLIESSCLEKIDLLEPHQLDIAALFKTPTTSISNVPLFASYLQEHQSSPTLVALDKGGKNRVEQLAQHLQIPFICLSKTRDPERRVSYAPLTTENTQNIQGKDLVLVDDMIDSGGTILKALELLLSYSPRSTQVIATHGVLSQNAPERLQESPLNQIVITNSIFHSNLPSKFKVLDIRKIL